MKILVTGGTVFVSRFTAEYFAKRGDEVCVLNRGTRPQPQGVRHIKCDRNSPGDALRGLHFDAVIDVAAYTRAQVETLVNSGISFDDYIFISSSAVYPETNLQPFAENQPVGCNSVWGDYGVNKLEAERFLTESVPGAYILRPPYFYGIYENLHREALAFDCALQGRPFCIPGKGEMKLHFFNVGDLCRFIEILLVNHPSRRIFNVGNSEPVTIKDWVTLCYKAAGAVPEFIEVDKSVPQRSYFCFHDYEYVLDVSAMCALMPETVPLSEGLKKEFDWYRNAPDCIANRKPYFDFIDKNLRG